MPNPSELLERVGEAVLPSLADNSAGVAVQHVAREVWSGWVRNQDADARRAEVAALRGFPEDEVGTAVAAIVKRLLPGRPGPVQASLARYLIALPQLLQHRVGRGLENADEVSRWLPSVLPRFLPGEKPQGVGDRVLSELLRADRSGEAWLATNPRLPDRPPAVLVFLPSVEAAARMLAWHQRVERGGPVAGLLPPEHTYLDAPAPCVQLAAPPGETMAALCREPGLLHARAFAQLVKSVALLHRRASPVGLGDLSAGDVLVQRGEGGKVHLLMIEGPAIADARADVLTLGRVGLALGLSENEGLAALLAECVAEDPLRRPADAQALLTRLEANPLIKPAGQAAPAKETLPARAAARKTGRVWDVLSGLDGDQGRREKQLTNSAGMPFVLVPSGSFKMGSPQDEAGRRDNEGPVHEVVIPAPFYLGVHPVTQEQYRRVMGANPSRFQGAAGGGPTHPVENVNWDDAVAFCLALSKLQAEHEAGRRYRLPTEAEWEYACRAGAATAFHFGAMLAPEQARFDASPAVASVPRTAPVGSYPRNNFGLHEMHGNVWEWCADWFDDGYYAKSPRSSPQGPGSGAYRVLRGGSWRNQAVTCRSAYRNALPPNQKQPFIGFRVVMLMEDAPAAAR